MAAAATSVTSARSAAAPLRAAVIGHTGRGNYGHGLAEIFQDRSQIILVGLADPVASGRETMARNLGIQRVYADWRELLTQERPNLVSVAMRHADQHAEVTLACVEAGAHCYVEKPFVRFPLEADAVLAAADRHRCRIAVAHTMRMSPAVRRLRQVVAEGRIGELREMHAFGKQDERAGGEDLMVLGPHLFDLMRLFAGDPLWVSARVQVQSRELAVTDRRRVKDEVGWVAGDRVNAQFAFGNGVLGLYTSDGRLRESTGHWGIEFQGSRGSARINCDLVPVACVKTASSWKDGTRREDWAPLEGVPLMAEAGHNRAPVGDWLEAIASGREPECSGRNGAWGVEMVMGIYQSALGGSRVTFPLRERGHPLDP
jgi:predicted dehydrogenase